MRGRIEEQPGICAGPAAVLLAIFLLVPLSAFGDVGDFFPTIFSSSGFLELSTMRQSEENTAAGRGTRSSDSLAEERLLLYLDGYVYHPRFIQFLMRGGFGMHEERYDNNLAGSFSENAFSTDYEFRAKVLPEHPYNLELYTQSATPYFRQTTAETRATDTQKGTIFNYVNKPLYINLSYYTGDSRARISSSEYRGESAIGSYLTGPFNNTASHSHTDTSTSMGMRTSADNSSFENVIKVGSVSLNSKVSENLSQQKSPVSAAFTSDISSWQEQFNAQLPWNFYTSSSYNVLKNTLTTEALAPKPQQESTTKTTSSNFVLSHKLYDSVRTSYSLNQTLNDTSTGDIKSITNSLNGIYTKKLPDGRLTVSGQASRSRLSQVNAPLIADEIHTAALFGTFTLLAENIDPATISLKVTSDTGALIDYLQSDYIVEKSGNEVLITIAALHPQILAEGHPPSYPYTFKVTYTLLVGTVEFETTIVGYAVKLALFDNLITPYYSHLHSSQEVLVGSIPGGPRETDTFVSGISIQKAPYTLVTEQRTVVSTVSPSRTLRNAVEFAKRMSDTLQLSAQAEHSKTVYGQGTTGTRGYTEQVSNAHVMIQKTVPRQKLTTSLSGSFSQRHATIDTDLYVLTGNLSWKVGILTVTSGASLNRAESKGTGGRLAMMSEFYYLTVSRKLF